MANQYIQSLKNFPIGKLRSEVLVIKVIRKNRDIGKIRILSFWGILTFIQCLDYTILLKFQRNSLI